MRKIVLILITAIVVACCVFIGRSFINKDKKEIAIVSVAKQFEDNGEENETEGIRQRLEQEKLMTLDPALGYVPRERLYEAEQMAARLKRNLREQNLDALTWNERGPNNIGGRTRAVIIDKTDASGNTVFVGSVSGGLWKTTNFKSATPTWTIVSSISANLSITTLAQDPNTPTIMYAGTGEWGNDMKGIGIYKSTNGGTTWSVIPSTTTGGTNVNDFGYVQKVLVYTNGDVYVACFGQVFCNRGGVLKSTNGGTNWTRVIGTYDGSGFCTGAVDFGAYDIEMAANGDLYASSEDYSNVKDNFNLTVDTTIGKIYRSNAGGSVGNVGSWVNITPPPAVAAGSYWQRIELATSPTDANTVYAIMQGKGNGVGGMRVTNDRGIGWTDITNTNLWCDQGSSTSVDFSRGQAWWDLTIAVKPDDNNTVFVGGVDLMKTTNGGTNWTQNTQWAQNCFGLPNIHADNHGIFHFPGAPNEFIAVNDGGIYYTNDNGSTYTNKSQGYRTIQYYSVALHPSAASNYMLAGSQDNGTHKFSTAGLGNITTATGGDGGFCFIDQSDTRYQVSSFYNSNYRISQDFGATFNISVNMASGRFINPTDYDNVRHIIYAGHSNSNLLRINNITLPAPLSTNSINFPGATGKLVSAVKVDPTITNRVWVAFSDGAPQLYYMDNAESATPSIVQVSLPTGTGEIASGHYISNIDVDPTNNNHLLMTVSNYGVKSIYESTDLGVNWTSLDNNGVNLPDMPVRWAIFLPDGFGFTGRESAVGGIMIATELGVWTTTTSAGEATAWIQSSSLPNVRVDMLKYRPSDNLVAAATHGRGLFTTSLEAILPIQLLSFDGRLENNTALLNWTTSREENSKEFDIEKSNDGVSFTKLGTVTAAGNSTTERKYSFRDVKLNTANYYRLKMYDKDGKNKLSSVVLLRYTEGKQNVLVLNTPFNNYLQIRFGKPAKQVKVQLLTSSGILVSEKTFIDTWGDIRWDIPVNLSKGAYVLRTIADGQTFVSKTMKQ